PILDAAGSCGIEEPTLLDEKGGGKSLRCACRKHAYAGENDRDDLLYLHHAPLLVPEILAISASADGDVADDTRRSDCDQRGIFRLQQNPMSNLWRAPVLCHCSTVGSARN